MSNPDKKLTEEQKEAPRTVNKGDVIDKSKSLEEKKEQVAVGSDNPDPVGQNTVPAYFPVEGEDGKEEALHHVRDAEEISDVIRQARVDEDGDRHWD